MDFSVEGIVSAVDDVSDTLDDISQSAVEASGAFESVNDSSEEASDSLDELRNGSIGLFGALKAVSRQSEEVEDDFEDIALDAQGATASVASLGTALQTIEDTDIDPPDALRDIKFGSVPTAETSLPRSIAEGADISPEEIFSDKKYKNRFISKLAGKSSGDYSPALRHIRSVTEEALEEGSDSIAEFAYQINRATNETVELKDVLSSLDDVTSRATEDFGFGEVEGQDLRIGQRVPFGGVTLPEIGPTGAFGNIASRLEGIDDSEDIIDGVADSINNLAGKTLISTNYLTAFKNQLGSSEDDADTLKKEIKDLGDAIQSISPTVGSLSANLGPFNIALRNVLITIPALVSVVGPLISVMGGLATAIIGVVGALGAFMAVGVVQLANELKSTFAGITSRAKAFKAILKGLKKAFWEALAPLRNIKFAGMDGINLFMRLMQDAVKIVNMVSVAIAEILQLDEVENFFLRIESALLGTSEAGKGTLTLIESLKTLLSTILPYITDFAVWFIEKLPNAFLFMSKISKELLPVIQEFGATFLDLFVTLTKAGSGVLTNLLPTMGLLLSVVDKIISALITLDAVLGPIADVFWTLLVTTFVVNATLFKTILVISSLSEIISNLHVALAGITGALMQVATGLILVIVGISLIIDGIKDLLKLFGVYEPLLEAINSTTNIFGSILSFVNNVIKDFTEALKESIPFGEQLLFVLRFLGSVAKIVAGVLFILTGGLFVLGGMAGLAGTSITGLTTEMDALIPSMSAVTIESGMVSSAFGTLTSITSITSASMSTLAISIASVAVQLLLVVGLIYLAYRAFKDLNGVVGILGVLIPGILASIIAPIGGVVIAIGVIIAVIWKVIETFSLMKEIIIVGATAIASALIVSSGGLYAILMVVSYALMKIYRNWGEIKKAGSSALSSIISKAEKLIDWLESLGISGDNFINSFIQAIPFVGDLILMLRTILDIFTDIDDYVKSIKNTIDRISMPDFSLPELKIPNLGGRERVRDSTQENISGMITGQGRAMRNESKSSTTNNTTNQNVTVNVDNSGSGEMDERERQSIFETIKDYLSVEQSRKTW